MKLKKKILFAGWACHNPYYTSDQAWRQPLQNIFEEYISFDPQEIIYAHGREEMNRRFLTLVAKEKPDYILFWLIRDEFFIETFLKINEISPHTRTLNYFGDDDTLFDNYSRYYARLIDYPIISQHEYIEGYNGDGIKNFFLSY